MPPLGNIVAHDVADDGVVHRAEHALGGKSKLSRCHSAAPHGLGSHASDNIQEEGEGKIALEGPRPSVGAAQRRPFADKLVVPRLTRFWHRPVVKRLDAASANLAEDRPCLRVGRVQLRLALIVILVDVLDRT